eukprot:10217456-Alexandrium_andersonii.AAC.1
MPSCTAEMHRHSRHRPPRPAMLATTDCGGHRAPLSSLELSRALQNSRELSGALGSPRELSGALGSSQSRCEALLSTSECP